jgi:hypothetical protein
MRILSFARSQNSSLLQKKPIAAGGVTKQSLSFEDEHSAQGWMFGHRKGVAAAACIGERFNKQFVTSIRESFHRKSFKIRLSKYSYLKERRAISFAGFRPGPVSPFQRKAIVLAQIWGHSGR